MSGERRSSVRAVLRKKRTTASGLLPCANATANALVQILRILSSNTNKEGKGYEKHNLL